MNLKCDPHRMILALGGLLITATAVPAQAAGSVEIVKVETRRVRQLMVRPQTTSPRGFTKTITLPEGKVFLVAWLSLKVKAEKDAQGNQRLAVDAKKIDLADAQGKKLPAVGRVSRDGRFDAYPPSFHYFGGAGSSGDAAFDAAFVVPEEAMTFTLHFGAAEEKLKPAEKIAAKLEPGSVATFKVNKVEVLTSLAHPVKLGFFDQPVGEFSETITAAAERFVAVHLEVQGKICNAAESGNFVFMPEDIGLLYGSQVCAAPVGFESYGMFSTDTTAFNGGPDGKGGFLPIQAKLIFPLPKGISKFRVLYLMHPVTDGALPK